MHLMSPLLLSVPGIQHGFGSIEEPVPAALAPDWDQAKPRWKQVHGVATCDVMNPGQECGEVDALFTRRPGQSIAVVTADCVPILLARRDGAAVAAVHAGWRGTRAHIVSELWKTLSAQGEKAADWVAAIGPAIGPCCYEVSPELARDFQDEFGGRTRSPAVLRSRYLDLPAINHSELLQLGLRDVDLLRACTKCAGDPDAPQFHSYRREGGGTRQYSVIGIKG